MKFDLTTGTPVQSQDLPPDVSDVVNDCHSTTVTLVDYPEAATLEGCCLLPQNHDEVLGNTFVMRRINLDIVLEVTLAEGSCVEAVRKNNSELPGYAVYYDHEGDVCHVVRIV